MKVFLLNICTLLVLCMYLMMYCAAGGIKLELNCLVAMANLLNFNPFRSKSTIILLLWFCHTFYHLQKLCLDLICY